MKKEMIEYLQGSRNAVKDEFILSREKTGNTELVFVTHPEIKKPLYALWNSVKTIRKYEKNKDDIIQVRRKGTGGKRAYSMLMIDELSKLIKNGISTEAAGAILKLSGQCLEWHTGRICRARDNKSMTCKMIADYLGFCITKTKMVLKELTTLNVIKYDKKQRAYFLNRNLIKKGAADNENKV